MNTVDMNLRDCERTYEVDPSLANGVVLLRTYQRVGDLKSYLRLRGKLGYVVETSVLPLPTRAQTVAFVDYVANAHSWYKHLPREEGIPFVFVLDPHVMMTTRDGRRYKPAVTREDLGVGHYSAMFTEIYREKFGFWTYHDGRTKLKGRDEYCRSVMATPRLKIASQGGHKVKIPADLILSGSAWLTSSVFGHSELTLTGVETHPDEISRDDRTLAEHETMLKAMQTFLSRLEEQQVDLGLRERRTK